MALDETRPALCRRPAGEERALGSHDERLKARQAKANTGVLGKLLLITDQ
jgi:hypothetical protein